MANISRNSFNESKGYDKVILQQGVPITDYDFNEAQDIQRFKLRRILKELFGDGAIEDGFKVVENTPAGQSVVIKAGTLYVSGWRLINEADYVFPLSAAPTSGGARTDYIYVECSETEIDSIMDPSIKHEKLTIEPTRRVKLNFTLKSGTSVPVDTETIKYYRLASINRAINDNVINSSDITDVRAVKITFEGTGFTVKGSATLGDDETDVIDIQGVIKNTSGNFGGKIKIEDSIDLTGNIDASGYVKTTGINVQKGKYYEVGRVPLFGIAGDIQFQSDSTAWEDVTDTLYIIFNLSAGHFPAVPTGATRHYAIRIAYSQDKVSGIANVRLINSALTATAIDVTLPAFTGNLTGGRRYVLSNYFTQATTSDNWKVQAKITDGSMTIMYIELIAYDVYS